MKVLIVEPGKEPRVAQIPNTLKAMQQTVDGYIQIVHPWHDSVALVCDEEGVLKDKPFNRNVTPWLQIAGTFFLCGTIEDDFMDLTDAQVELYTEIMRRYGQLAWAMGEE